ncbi:MAG: c-type cytochrome, partial [Rhodospirillales bacterium]|nr:c-type cytochrome [Rhodospirillales bacterium]
VAAVPSAAPPAPASPAAFAPPPDSAIPDSPFGQMVRLGERIFTDTGHAAPQYVGNALRCSNCHIDGGRLAGAAPLWASYVAFPTYRSKNRHVNTFAERLQGCFRFSMNGTAPPLGDKVLVALESYAYFLARGAPTGIEMPGRGFPRLARPAQAPDYARGAAVFAQNCALCHQADGAGQSAGGRVVFPPLWGPHSFNWGAGMTSIANAAAFIKANMPYGKGDSLTDQQAWDVAMFVDSHERPQDPRFAGTIAATRAKFHDTPDSMYGVSLNGVLLGQGDPKSP